MSKITYKPLEDKIGTEEIFDLVFRDSSVKLGLLEFPSDIFKKITAYLLLFLVWKKWFWLSPE